MNDMTYLDIFEIKYQFKIGNLSPLELCHLYSKKINESNNPVFISQFKNEIIETSGKKISKQKLFGIPFSCKDLFHVKGQKTTGGSRVMEHFISQESAFVIDLLNAEGAILQGKNNLHEFAYGATGVNAHFGTVTNPYDSKRLAGGSSSGSAAAVALGMSAFSLGTDTGGSVRAPAALCGVVGFKPTSGRVSLRGVVPYCWTLDHVGTFTRSVKDAALIFDIIGKHDSKDPSCVNAPDDPCLDSIHSDIEGIKVGVPVNFFFEHCDPEIEAATRQAIDTLAKLGANIIPIEMPSLESSRTVSLTVQLPEALSAHSDLLKDNRDKYSDEFRSGFAVGQFILAEHYIRAKRCIEGYRQEMKDVFDKVDIIITPGCPSIAPFIDDLLVNTQGLKEPAGNAITRYTSFFNMTGNPAITLPSGLHSKGLPMSVQLISRLFDEKTLLKVAHQLEENSKKIKTP